MRVIDKIFTISTIFHIDHDVRKYSSNPGPCHSFANHLEMSLDGGWERLLWLYRLRLVWLAGL